MPKINYKIFVGYAKYTKPEKIRIMESWGYPDGKALKKKKAGEVDQIFQKNLTHAKAKELYETDPERFAFFCWDIQNIRNDAGLPGLSKGQLEYLARRGKIKVIGQKETIHGKGPYNRYDPASVLSLRKTDYDVPDIPDLLTMDVIKKTFGWTESMIKEYLPDPKLVENPISTYFAPMRLWNAADIEALDKTEEIQKKKKMARKRKSNAADRKKQKEEKLEQGILNHIPESYPDLYPLARSMERHFTLHIGPTNSGKTYMAMERLKETGSGMYLGPLRLLAFEKQEELNEEGYPCSLITGEEESIVENARFTSSTIEMADLSREVKCAVIDEAQMLSDPFRGGSWTAAILGLPCLDIQVCAAPEAEDILVSLIEECGDTYEIVRHERKTPLVIEEETFHFPKDVKPGDALIVFSRRNVHAVAAELQRIHIPCGIIYGNLPYDVRQEEARKFRDGKTLVIVSTDAISMGMNLPIRRIVFLKTTKFDGIEERPLTMEEMKQIAGRAGRYGIFEEGRYNIRGNKNLKKQAKEELENPGEPITEAMISFPPNILDMEGNLSKILAKWEKITVKGIYRKQDISEKIKMASTLERIHNEKELIYQFITFVFDTKDMGLYEEWIQMFRCRAMGRDYEYYGYLEPHKNSSLEELEKSFKICDLIFQYARKFNKREQIEEILGTKNRISKAIIQILSSQKLKRHTCKKCKKILPWDYPYKTCETCRERNRYYGYYRHY